MTRWICAFTLLMLLCGWGCSTLALKKSDLRAEMEIARYPGPVEELPTISVQPFSLERTIPDPQVVGEARRGPGFPSQIRSEEPVPLILLNHLKEGFAMAGFRLGEGDKCAYTISGQIERFWVNEGFGASCEWARATVRYDLIVRDRGGKFLWGDTIEGRHYVERRFDVTREDIPALVRALNRSVESIFRKESFWKTMER
jgi:hypothetical protein